MTEKTQFEGSPKRTAKARLFNRAIRTIRAMVKNTATRAGRGHLKGWSVKNDFRKGLPESLFLERDPGITDVPAEPYTFGSCVCRAVHFRLPLFRYWSAAMRSPIVYHRKYWEWVFICHALSERGLLKDGRSGLGFGVGREPLVSLFASRGVRILATDLEEKRATELGWVQSNQHSSTLEQLNKSHICEQGRFASLASFQYVDMNNIPSDLGIFDFCWSSCSLEHLGSIENGFRFIRRSLDFLRPGGVAIHTTEFNLSSDSDTIDNNPYYVVFRRRDLLGFGKALELEGFQVEPIDFAGGNEPIERYVDLPPYEGMGVPPHLRLELEMASRKYVSTSIGLIIKRLNR